MQGFCKTPILRHNILTLPPQVTNLVLSQSPGTITGSFNGVAAQYTQPISYLVVYKAGGIPNLPTDGNSISITANGSLIYSFNIPGLSNGTSYGVRIFVLGNFGFQTSQEAQGTITPVAGLALSSLPEGGLIKLTENGIGVNFYVAKHNYESGLNGNGRTLAVRKDCYDNRVWDSGNVNAYASSDIDAWFNSPYKNMLDVNIRSLIGTTKIRYTPGNGNNTVGTLERPIFALSFTELGESHSSANVEGSDLPISSTLKISYLNGRSNHQWTRSPTTGNPILVWRMYPDGSIGNYYPTYAYGSRPAFTLPANMMFQTTPNSDGSYSPV